MPLPVNPIDYYKGERDRALRRGDVNQANAISADLRRWGVREEANGTAQRRGRGRPKLPRCEHDQIASRCAICNEEAPEVKES